MEGPIIYPSTIQKGDVDGSIQDEKYSFYACVQQQRQGGIAKGGCWENRDNACRMFDLGYFSLNSGDVSLPLNLKRTCNV